MTESATFSGLLPDDADDALLVGRVWSDAAGGPLPVSVVDSVLYDVSELAPTVSQILEVPDVGKRLRNGVGNRMGRATEILDGLAWQGPSRGLKLLAPVDLQCIKACGVTFSVSVLERVVEEQAAGDLNEAERLRTELTTSFGDSLSNVAPGSAEAAELKHRLIAEGLWSQYLEVAIGPDAEVFTKAPALAAVGWGDFIGIRRDSDWNNPEPEIVLVCDSKGQVVGATLGNDVNLRDFEGRSALLLGKGKDNNASASIGPFIRLFTAGFDMSSVQGARVALSVSGDDCFQFSAESSMQLMTRDPMDLVAQTSGVHHQYPDGFALYLGSPIAPTQDRQAAGKGFTHVPGDIVAVSSAQLGSLVNKVCFCDEAPPWQFGIGALMANLARRGFF